MSNSTSMNYRIFKKVNIHCLIESTIIKRNQNKDLYRQEIVSTSIFSFSEANYSRPHDAAIN